MAAKVKNPKKQTTPVTPQPKGWITTKTGLRILILVSVLLAAFETWQISSFKPLLESILWGLGFGASIWIAAAIYYVFTRLIRRG